MVDCRHPAFYCLKCLLANVSKQAKNKTRSCPVYPGCTFSSETIANLQEAYTTMYPSSNLSHEESKSQAQASTVSAGSTLRAVMLSGEEFVLPYGPNVLVKELKEELKKQTKVEPEKQKLLFKGEELVSMDKTLSDYCINAGATIHLLVILYKFTGNCQAKDVVFDLNWSFPSSGQDFLDGTCLFYSGTTRKGLVDYCHKKSTGASHSGDIMKKTSGHHDINISLSKIPPTIDRLFFTLSAYNCLDISLFRSPSVKLFYKDTPSEQLTSYSISSAGHSSAVVMCCLQRIKDGWHVWTLGRHSSGTVRDYSEMDNTCRGLIQSGLLPSV